VLKSLYIKNYALIDELNVQFNNGLSIITGETGAGKSILLGGLSLVLGKRADLSQVKKLEEKCIIEAVFDVGNYNLKSLFKSLDLDYDAQTIVRREILPSGKSRAFINDTPATLDNLSKLSNFLIDIHSQHQTQQLVEDGFQFQVIDALANNKKRIESYSEQLKQYKSTLQKLEDLKISKASLIKEYDYNLFLLKELESIDLDMLDLEELEEKFEELNNVETIAEKLSNARVILSTENLGVIDQINSAKNEINRISNFGSSYESLSERLTSISIELDDILAEIDNLENNLSADPLELQTISVKLQSINNLLQKHSAMNLNELIAIRDALSLKINDTNSLDETIENLQKQLGSQIVILNTVAEDIHINRTAIIPELISKLESILKDLGMPNAKFRIDLNKADEFLINGKDNLQFLFMANKGSTFNELKKSASGGELSRIMLAIKSILADYIQLPSIMFDEIDTGVSGEISKKMGEIMQQMSKRMQVFTITHLPQIAAKGNTHYKVYKTDVDEVTHTQLRQLNEDERIVEIAQMLGGINVTKSALDHAKQLLN
jgi:DNA repair protein RecN (Recombination protein N)